MGQKCVVLAGGSGFLGTSLSEVLLKKGYQIINLTRSPVDRAPGIQDVKWDGVTLGAWAIHLDGAEAVVNFTGKAVDCRYTETNKREIIDSRVNSVKALAQAIDTCENPPPVWVQAGSLAFYGNAGDKICDEESLRGEGFSTEVCQLWEAAFNGADTPRTRKVFFRIGFALGRDGGALEKLTKLVKLFLGGSVGSGRQYISWLHIDDLNRMFEWAIEREDIQGTYNATGPSPVTNAAFMVGLRRSIGRPWSPPTPAPLVRIGARLMGTEGELALTGRRSVPKRFLQSGFAFEHTDLQASLDSILNGK